MKQPRTAGAGRVTPIAVLIALVMATACADTSRSLLSGATTVPPDVEQACTFATTKCTHCHPIDRVVLSRGMGIERWQMTVEHMRLKPSSGISPSDAEVVFRCLRFIEELCFECKQRRS